MTDVNFEDVAMNVTLGDIVQKFTEEDLQKALPVVMQDVDADTKTLVDTYQSYIAAGNFSEAETYRAAHTELETRIWDAYKANSMLVYAAYAYMYAKSQKQQCVVSATEPTAKDNDTDVGQVEGDIWFKIVSTSDGIKMCIPYVRNADGTYTELCVSEKQDNRIDEIQQLLHSLTASDTVKALEIVDTLPEAPNANTIYFVKK